MKAMHKDLRGTEELTQRVQQLYGLIKWNKIKQIK